MDKKKKYFIGLGSALILIVFIGVSFAWWTNTASQESINKITSDCLSLEIEDINHSAINLEKTYPITDAEASLLTPYTFKITNVCNNNTEYSVNLEIMDLGDTQIASQYLALNFNKEGKKLLSEYQSVEPTYNKSDYTASEARALTSGVLVAKESVTYTLNIWIDESVTIDDPVMNKEFVGKISVTSSLTQLASYKLSELIMKKSTSDASIEKIEHEATEQTPELIDYRYVGSNPNNYIYFGCEVNDCTEDNLYRIIGVIPTQSSENGEYENRVKLIKANYYTENKSGLLLDTNANAPAGGGTGKGYNWNSSANNKWEESVLQKNVLNGIYWNSLGKYQSYISPAIWYIGASNYNDYATYTPDQFYLNERSNIQSYSKGLTNYVENIGLMYPSDYGYSSGSNNKGLSIYENREKYINDTWLYNLENKYYEWTISPENVYNYIHAWYLNPSGGVYTRYVYDSNDIWGIRPTFYLKEDILYVGGEGTSSNPYRINLKEKTLSDYLIAKSESDSTIEKVSHEATEQTPSLTDYRYIGVNPNNYVYFGCSDNCTEDNLYRIIGVIPSQSSEDGEYENRIKLIKVNYYTENESGLLKDTNASLPAPGGKGYQWNSTANNKWEESTLQKQVLNGVYWNSLGEYQNYINSAKWHLGSPHYNSYTTYTPDQFYNIERSNTKGYSKGVTNYVGNIGLIYPSDYAYSIGSDYRGESLHNNAGNYVNNAWLYNLDNKYYEWTMIPESSNSDVRAWRLLPAGYIGNGSVSYSNNVYGVRPTFYLKSSVLYSSGDGSLSNPYQLAL